MDTEHNLDLVLLTQSDFIEPKVITPHIHNVLLEDELLTKALVHEGLKVQRAAWDDPNFDWSHTQCVLFRAIWDYYHRFTEFNVWLTKQSTSVQFINAYPVIKWNLDKHYLIELSQKGIPIPPTHVLEQGDFVSITQIMEQLKWDKIIIKPAIAGAARHAYLIDVHNAHAHQELLNELLANEAMLVQQYQENITSKGEVSFVVFGGQYSHAVLKKAKPGEFRVQDDFGGTVHSYKPSRSEIAFVEHVVSACGYSPIYARIDLMWNNDNELCVSELELIEPELWFREDSNAAALLAKVISNHLRKQK